jgi:hypothetical protein
LQVIVKLATVFGHEDRFLNWIAELTTSIKMPFFPLIDGGKTLTQPVFVGDVARGVHTIVQVCQCFLFNIYSSNILRVIIYSQRYEDFKGTNFQFVGPAEYTHKEVVEFVHDIILTKKPLIEVPLKAAQLTGKFTEQFIAP